MDTENALVQDIAGIITAMTDAEKPFLYDAVKSVLTDPGIGQVVLCLEDRNTWAEATLGSLMTDPRLEVIRLPLAPLGAVRNYGLRFVKLPWVAYCDGDDVWCMGKTLTQRHYAVQTGCDFVGADHYLTDDQGSIRAFATARYLPMPSSWMVRTDIMRQYPFDESPFTPQKDESGEWWMRTAGRVRKARCPKMLLCYRVRADSLSSTASTKRKKAKIVALASKPILGSVIFLLTGGLWLMTRRKVYLWHPSWGEEPMSPAMSAGAKAV